MLLIAQESITVNGQKRNMIVYSPKNLPANRPLIITMHGLGGNPIQHRQETNWNAVADTAMLLVVYPEGTDNRWDIGGKYDLNFIEAIMDQMYMRYAIDKNRIYISGFSMGGMMTYYTANNLAHKIAAFGPVSGYMASNASSSRAIPLIHVHGMIDDLVPYAPGNSSFTGAYFEGIHAHLKKWIDRDKCDKIAVKISPYPIGTNGISSYEVWRNGDCETEVALVSVQGVGHWFSSDLRGVHTTKELWKFFKRFNLQCGAKLDCNGVSSGTATLDKCDRCVGGTTGKTACTSIGEAEELACIYDGILESSNAGYKGTSYINVNNAIGTAIMFPIKAASSGNKTISFRYASSTDRPATLKVDGVGLASAINFPSTGAFTTYKTIDLTLNLSAGTHKLELVSATADGLANIDQIGYVSQGLTTASCTDVITSIITASEDFQSTEIYPNPSTSNFHIRLKLAADFEILNAKGITILSFKNVKEMEFGDDLQPGVYFAKFGGKVQKFVKY